MNRNPKCIDRQSVRYVCVDCNCQKQNPFMCDDKHGQCEKNHFYCTTIKWIAFKQKIQDNNLNNNPNFKLLCAKVQKIYKKLIEQFQNEQNKFNEWIKNHQKQNQILKFYEDINGNREINWKGSTVHKLKQQKKTIFDNLIEKQIQQSIDNLTKIKEHLLTNIKGIYLLNQQQKIKPNYQNNNQISALEQNMKIKMYHIKDLNQQLLSLIKKPINLELRFVKLIQFSLQRYD